MNVRSAIGAYFDNWTAFEKVWLTTFALVGVGIWHTMGTGLIGLAALLTGMITVVLVAKGEISNYAFGLVNVILYGWISYQSQLYGEVMLNWGFFLVAQFVGYYMWRKNMSATGVVEVKSFTTRQRLGVYASAAVAIVGYGFFLKWLNGNLPFFDAASTVLSVIAMALMVVRSKDQWVIWLVINIVSIYIWVQTYLESGEGLNMVTMWSAYLVNSVYGYYNWNAMEKV